MKFLLLIHNNAEALEGLTEEQLTEMSGGREHVAATARTLLASGELLSVLALKEPGETKDIQVVAGTPVISDRPLLETKEYLAGAMVLDCASIERALEIVTLIPLVNYRRVELREIRLDEQAFLAELGEP
ncbi:YciI family protein [Kribbella solani]|uniref:YciI family protein n=1 Tax=Kribbella solani TaxID=236067 RepID=UPI0029BDE3C8|nr:YciI family protein [Kribbella solani]MDX2974334.1 YciI family protein [Kribbella solani]